MSLHPGRPSIYTDALACSLSSFVMVCTATETAVPEKPSLHAEIVPRAHARRMLAAHFSVIGGRIKSLTVAVPTRIVTNASGVPVIEWCEYPARVFVSDDGGPDAAVNLPPPSPSIAGVRLRDVRTIVGCYRTPDDRIGRVSIQTIGRYEQQAIEALKARSLWIESCRPTVFDTYWWAVPRWSNRDLCRAVVAEEAAWTLKMSGQDVYTDPDYAREEHARHVGNTCQEDGLDRPPICTACKGVPKVNPFPEKIENWSRYIERSDGPLGMCICETFSPPVQA